MIYTAGRSRTSLEGSDQDSFLESMAEAGKSVVDALEGNILPYRLAVTVTGHSPAVMCMISESLLRMTRWH